MANLYTLPQDVYDALGTEGGQLRLDDHQLATGQTITVTAQANAGTTTVTIQPLTLPLLAGTVLEFDGGGMPAVCEVTLSATAGAGSSSLTVNALSAALMPGAAAQDSGVNLATAARLIKACQYGTSQVQLYCLTRYNDSDLYANSLARGSVSRWATSLASRWLASRRGQTPPQGIADQAEESLEEMKQVRVGMLNVDAIATRSAGWPFISNVTVDVNYNYAKVRVEEGISDLTPTQYGQFVDWNSALFIEW